MPGWLVEPIPIFYLYENRGIETAARLVYCYPYKVKGKTMMRIFGAVLCAVWAAFPFGAAAANAVKQPVALIAGPDHMRAYEAVKALKAGEKTIAAAPAARTVEEADIVFASAAKKPGFLAFGDLGPFSATDRATLEKVATLGNVSRVAVELNGKDVAYLGTARPDSAIPENESWWQWLGVMPCRPNRPEYHQDESWRAYLDFGTGPLGKDGVRVLRPVFVALRPGRPLWAERVSVSGESADCETYPKKATIRFGFSSGLELTVSWGDGNERVRWTGERGSAETLPTPVVSLAEQAKTAAFTVPAEARDVTAAVLLGCCAAMHEGRVTCGDCEKRYMRDGWEWEGL